MDRIKRIEESLVHLSVELGIETVQEIARQTIAQKPNIKLKHFMQGLDKHLEELRNNSNK